MTASMGEVDGAERVGDGGMARVIERRRLLVEMTPASGTVALNDVSWDGIGLHRRFYPWHREQAPALSGTAAAER